MEIGDIVIIIKLEPGDERYFSVGDKARLITQDTDGNWWADFTMNKKYCDDGRWLIGPENFNSQPVNALERSQEAAHVQ